MFKLPLNYTLVLLTIFISYNSSIAFTDPYPKNLNVDAINYVFKIVLSDETDEIICEVIVDIRFRGSGEEQLRLDLINKSDKLDNKGMQVYTVTTEGKDLIYSHKNDELIINLQSPSTANELKTFTIKYRGVPATGLIIGDNKYGDRTFFSDNWPNKARNWLATIDHPYDKAMCEFVVTAPNHYQVISNGLKIEESNLEEDKRLTHWRQSVPIAPWLFVLGVAEFAVQYVDDFNGKSIETWVYPQDRDKGFYDFAVPTKKVLEFYSSYVGPFAYEKLANIQSNSVGGGMEAASAILYGDNSVTGDRSERWRNVVIHEIAHQWFGNAVTEYDWDDVWLSEGFATYFTLLFIEHEYGRDAFLKGLGQSQDRVNSFYVKNPDYRLVHDNLSDMRKVTSSQTYQKGSWVLHMLRGVVGTDNFWRGIRTYYEKYYNKNATTNDFRLVMEEASGMDLEWFFQQWLYKGGTLKYDGKWLYNKKNGELEININQIQNDGSLFKMPLELGIYFKGEEKPQIEKVFIDKSSNTLKVKVENEPVNIILDPNKWILMEATFNKENSK
jgi:aminopeptidase N